MIKKIVKLAVTGVTVGCTIFCLISMAGYSAMGNEWFLFMPRGFNGQVTAAAIIGLCWSLPAIVYDNEKLSRLQQILVHTGTGVSAYLLISFYMGWVPLGNIGIMLGSLTAMLLIALFIWFCFYLYYKREAEAINRELKGKEL